MKKLNLLIFSILTLLMAGCVEEAGLPGENNDKKGESSETYRIRFNLSTPPAAYTRDPESTSNGHSGSDYEAGKEAENTVSKVRFYFFDLEGNTVKVKAGEQPGTQAEGEFGNYYDVEASSIIRENEGNTDILIEAKFSVTLSLQFENGIRPSQVVVIVNPNPELTEYSNNAENQPFLLYHLQKAVMNFKKDSKDNSDLTESGNFVMSNSTYVQPRNTTDNEGKTVIANTVICPVSLSTDNFATGSDNPTEVKIFVERVLARLDVTFETSPDKLIKVEGKDNTYKTGQTFKPSDNTGEPIYVRFEGWAVTAAATESRLLKKVDASWDTESFFTKDFSWNADNHYRSFWAINPPDPRLEWFSYTHLTKKDTDGKLKDGCMEISESTPLTAYMQENANPYNAGTVEPASPDLDHCTKAIFAATLVDEEGNAITIAEYDSKQYTVEGLKNAVAQSLDLYFEDGTDSEGNTKYTQIKPEQLDFETYFSRLLPEEEPGVGHEGTYYVYFTLREGTYKDGNEEKKMPTEWYHKSETEGKSEPKEITDTQKYIDSMTFPVKIWKDGHTYFYFDIPHCEGVDGMGKDSPGYYGVVRNTLYNAVITKINTLGTPVYNPDEFIYPETPEKTGNQLEVTVNAVKWRKVGQDLQLSW